MNAFMFHINPLSVLEGKNSPDFQSSEPSFFGCVLKHRALTPRIHSDEGRPVMIAEPQDWICLPIMLYLVA